MRVVLDLLETPQVLLARREYLPPSAYKMQYPRACQPPSGAGKTSNAMLTRSPAPRNGIVR